MIVSQKNLFSSLDDLDDSPSLVLGQGTGLHQQDLVAFMAGVSLVMSLDFNGPFYDLVVKGVFHVVVDSNDDGFIHLIADNDADPGLSQISFHDLVSSLSYLALSSCCMMVMTRAMSFLTALMRIGLSS